MPKGELHLARLLATMTPELSDQRVAFLSFADGNHPFTAADTIGTFREKEGLTVAADLAAAEASGHPILFKAAWITLTVHSDFEAVGLTAAFAKALTEAGISANVIAGAFHDHIFVPQEKAQAAMAVLVDLQRRSAGD